MRSDRLVSLMMAALAALLLSTGGAVAQQSAFPVHIDMRIDSYGVGGTGAFNSSLLPCASGTFVVNQGAVTHTFTCDVTGDTFQIGVSGPITSNGFSTTWFFASGTGPFRGISGRGNAIHTANCPGPPCDITLSGTARVQ